MGLEKTKRKTHKPKHRSSKKNITILSNNTPSEIIKLSNNVKSNSYTPTINQNLVSLKTIKRNPIINCNNARAFALKTPLKIGILKPKKTCYAYSDDRAKKYLLNNLKANKHIDPNIIVPPIQELANCWFNTMFVSLFISDKGRKFFHFMRQLMIEGKQQNGTHIPAKLKDGFALLNYAIDASLTGNQYAYILNTNAIIKNIYESVPDQYKTYIPDVDEGGNPLRYYKSLINYINNNDLNLMVVQGFSNIYNKSLGSNIPHIIVVEVFADLNKVEDNESSFFVEGVEYVLDSCIIRDTKKNHFSSLLTCETREMAYDGMSFHRLSYMNWKKHINSDFKWQFKGSRDDGKNLTWTFSKGYYMMFYYRNN